MDVHPAVVGRRRLGGRLLRGRPPRRAWRPACRQPRPPWRPACRRCRGRLGGRLMPTGGRRVRQLDGVRDLALARSRGNRRRRCGGSRQGTIFGPDCARGSDGAAAAAAGTAGGVAAAGAAGGARRRAPGDGRRRGRYLKAQHPGLGGEQQPRRPDGETLKKPSRPQNQPGTAFLCSTTRAVSWRAFGCEATGRDCRLAIDGGAYHSGGCRFTCPACVSARPARHRRRVVGHLSRRRSTAMVAVVRLPSSSSRLASASVASMRLDIRSKSSNAEVLAVMVPVAVRARLGLAASPGGA